MHKIKAINNASLSRLFLYFKMPYSICFSLIVNIDFLFKVKLYWQQGTLNTASSFSEMKFKYLFTFTLRWKILTLISKTSLCALSQIMRLSLHTEFTRRWVDTQRFWMRFRQCGMPRQLEILGFELLLIKSFQNKLMQKGSLILASHFQIIRLVWWT